MGSIFTCGRVLFLNLSRSSEAFEDAFEPLLNKFEGWNLPILKWRDVSHMI